LINIIRKNHDIVISKEMLEEFLRVTNDAVIRQYVNDRDVTRFISDLTSIAKVVKIRARVKAVKRDPSDDVILGTCYNGKARFVVSGDRDLLELGSFRRARIVTVDEMCRILEDER
jgi:putative PIN family toxin of toxin-antitoxin system